ncbi:unnamed protein product [Rotaria magnacalcarata]|uniref:Uncharacterized protein n=2 Tax=Rotaria magnacalcarata TaxID=392030 RepID=A0A816MD07_9BILA|nr:unnamed protein product [Rotaria magnacalcarata]CAF1227519.1 unnamed protein product [Rotaria magnacalcarata]CAF1902373.1 unnamed protein product [Rotaria magnacalcarata]CAF1929343.1 unnamed protein product [Rotaria magnacalcarata]CAF1962570.1 unnamed protein product [Rotaria magnacalcarata]
MEREQKEKEGESSKRAINIGTNTFQPSAWSVGESTWRTNNYTGAQNHRLYTRVVQPHPNLWRFLQC